MTSPAHQVTWFDPERPVDGATVFVKPPVDGQVAEFRAWLAREEFGGATVVLIEDARRFFGWTT